MTLLEKLGKTFVITTELGPVKGALYTESIEKARDYLPLDAINIHDCPMANLRINAVMMGSLVQQELKVDAVPHFTCRDRSLLGTQADLLGAHALGIRHLLVTTGDPPKHGPYKDDSKAVYNYNTIELIKLVKKLNQGHDYLDKEIGGNTDFSIACTATPTAKDLDSELRKMERKIKAGADFFQTQVVYDAERTIRFMDKAKDLGKPIIIGIMPLKSLKMATYMKNHVEGIEVPDQVISKLEAASTGIEICCDLVQEIYSYCDGVHIMAMGDVKGTNAIVEHVSSKCA